MKKITLLIALFILLHPTTSIFAERQISEEAIVFQQVRNGVFTIFGDEGHGSGFLFDSRGLVITNQHVIANSSYIRVQINDEIKVPAKLLVENKEKDIAIILINPKHIKELPVLKIAKTEDSKDIAFEGEKVIAIGSPINQIKILTSGIIGKI